MPNKTRTYVLAAIEVLRSEKRPLTSNEITKLAVERGFIRPKGKTPGATMTSELYVGINNDINFPIKRLSQFGTTRAVRGSVRWMLKKTR